MNGRISFAHVETILVVITISHWSTIPHISWQVHEYMISHAYLNGRDGRA